MRRLPAPLPLLACLLAVFLIAPFAAGLAQLGGADWAGADLPALTQAVIVSVASASLATLLVALGGIPLGYALARRPGRWMATLGFVVQLPLALPPLASGVLLLFLLGYSSPLGRLTNGALTDSFPGIVLAEAFVAAPFLIIAARSAFASVDPMLEDVAATLGHRPGAIFRRVSLPLAWRTILAGLLLAWLRAFGEFGATVMVAYHPYSLPVYTYVAFGSEGLPAMLPVLAPTLLAAVGVMLASHWATAPRASAVMLPVADTAPTPTLPAALPAPPGRTLEFAFRRRLDGFALEVAWRTEARRLAILGASGSGKSLTLRLIAGLEPADSAALQLGGCDLRALPPDRRGIAYVPQSYGLFPHLSAGAQLRFPVGSDPAQAQCWAARLGLSGLEHRLPAELSLGQQQRVALARALCRRARLLLLDEPFSALDAPLRLRLRQEMRALQAEVDATTILVTHDPAEAMALADEILLLESGRVLQAGPVETLFLRPASEAAARLLGAEAAAYGRAVAPDRIDLGGGVHLAVAGPALTPGTRVGWAVRPEQIRLDESGLPATVLHRAAAPDGWQHVTLRLGDAVLVARADPGATASCIRIDPAVVQVWPADG